MLKKLLYLPSSYLTKLSKGSIKCLKKFGNLLVTGGYDEILRLYNINTKKEIGQLTGHTGTITCIEQFQRSIITGSEDGLIKL